MKPSSSAQSWLPDLAGGVTTAIVSLPLALTFGVASGAGPRAGLYGAVCVGLFAALFGSSRRLISEPTGPMTVMLTAVIASLSASHPDLALPLAFAVVMVAGVFQILLGLLKLGPFITQMPYSVISGFMSGIGVILVLMQLPPLLGQPSPAGGIPGVVRALPELVGGMQLREVGLAVGALFLLFLYPTAWRRRCPPQLLVLLIGTGASLLLPGAESIRRIGDIPTGWPALQVPSIPPELITRVLLDGMVLGTLGAIDTILTAMIADSLTRTYHDSNRELVGQGIGNLAAGVCGGLPGAGATMGTVVNIQVGALSARAGIIRALLLLGVVLGAAPLAAPIPMAILAAIAVKVGFDILDWSFLRRAHEVSRTNTAIMYGVLLLTVCVDLIVAVGVGVFIANMLTIQRLSSLQAQNIRIAAVPGDAIQLTPEEEALLHRASERVVLFYLSGPMIFGVAKAIAREHAAMEQAEVLIMDVHDVPLLGVTVGLALENMVIDALQHGAKVYVVGARGQTRERLQRLGLLDRERVFEAASRRDAIEAVIEGERRKGEAAAESIRAEG